LVLLVWTTAGNLDLHGGLVTGGLYVLALQLVLSAFLLSAIDDFRDPGLAEPGRQRRWYRLDAAADAGPLRIRQALWRFYSRRPAPAFVLALGLAIPLAVVAIGALDGSSGTGPPGGVYVPALEAQLYGSEVAMGLVLAAVALPLAWRRATGVIGWVTGFSTGVLLAQLAHQPGTDLTATVQGYTAFGALLCGIWVARLGVDRIVRRRRESVGGTLA
jgi:hypothetical protein